MRALAKHELGIGVAYGPAGAATDAAAAGYDFVEVSPRARLGALPAREAACGVLNSAWLTVGGSCEPDGALLNLLEQNVALRRPAYVVERLGFNRVPAGGAPRATGFPLPPSYTLDGVAVAVRRICALRERLGVPVAFEIGSNYLPKRPGELSDAAFYAEIARQAECGIVLAVASLRANEANGRVEAATLIDGLPLERIWEIHVSAMTACRGRAIDSQHGLVPADVRVLAERIVPRLPALRALVYEVRPESLNSLSALALGKQRAWLAEIWNARGTEITAQKAGLKAVLPGFEEACVRVAAWERDIATALAGARAPQESDAAAFALLATLIAAERKAAISEGAELSVRLLEATLGRQAFADLIERYCAQTCAQTLAATEALRFLQFVESERTEIPYLREVVAFERAASQALHSAQETACYFTCEPTEIFRALLRHDRPYVSDRRPHVVHVGPRGIRIEAGYRPAG